MGKDLHPTIPPFLLQRMNDHSMVESCELVEEDDFYSLVIVRRRYGDTIHVVLSDEYLFTESSYDELRPKLRVTQFVLIARPEGGFTDAARDRAGDKQIGIGKLAELMGALNSRQIWKYRPKKKI